MIIRLGYRELKLNNEGSYFTSRRDIHNLYYVCVCFTSVLSYSTLKNNFTKGSHYC